MCHYQKYLSNTMPLTFKKALPQAKYDWDWDWEPDELRELKFELANIKCDCAACKQGVQKETPIHKGVQADQKYYSSDRFIQVTPESVLEEVVRSQTGNQQCMDHVCPLCMVSMNLLRAGVSRVVKDEEVETNTMLTLEKSTGRAWDSAERTTSVIKNLKSDVSSIERSPSAATKSMSGFTFNDLLSASSSETDQFFKPGNRDKVKFLDNHEKEKRQQQCTCFENLIDSIRPPLIGF